MLVCLSLHTPWWQELDKLIGLSKSKPIPDLNHLKPQGDNGAGGEGPEKVSLLLVGIGAWMLGTFGGLSYLGQGSAGPAPFPSHASVAPVYTIVEDGVHVGAL